MGTRADDLRESRRPPSRVDVKPPRAPFSLEAVGELFADALRVVWGEAGRALDTEAVLDPPPADGALFALRFDHDVAAVGRELVRPATHYVLAVAPRALELDLATARRALLHEAIHAGYPEHSAAFKRVARTVGAPMTEAELLGRFAVELQSAPRRRWREVYVASSLVEATGFALRAGAGPGRYRVIG